MASSVKTTFLFILFTFVFADLTSAQRGRPSITTRPPIAAASTVKPTVSNLQDPQKPRSRVVKFPDEDDFGVESVSSTSDDDEIPLELRRELDEVADMSEFFKLIDNSNFEDSDPFDVDGRTGALMSPSGERDAATPAKAANCIPELQKVSLMQSNDPSVLYYPGCTRIERCGGCCNSELLTCQPTKTETVVLQVVKTQYAGGKKMKFAGKEKIPVEKHLACKCQCKVKESDCSSNQIYNRGACRCECKNNADRTNCLADDTRYWDANTCMCRCRMDLRSSESCSTGFFYSEETCGCEPFPNRRNDVWSDPSFEDNVYPRNVPKIEKETTSTVQPSTTIQQDVNVQKRQRLPVIVKVDDEKEEEEKKAPIERFTFAYNWRNQFFSRLTTPKRLLSS